MLNVGAGELVVILVAALVLLGPKRLPELARGLGKFMREFRRQTDEVRMVVEREFYRMDQEVGVTDAPPATAVVEAKAEPPDPSKLPHDEQGRLILPSAPPEGTVPSIGASLQSAAVAAPVERPAEPVAPDNALSFDQLQARAADALKISPSETLTPPPDVKARS